MKKFSLVLALLMVISCFSLVSCSEKETVSSSKEASYNEVSNDQPSFTIEDTYGEWYDSLDSYRKVCFMEPSFIIYEDGTLFWDGCFHSWTACEDNEAFLLLFDVTLNEEYASDSKYSKLKIGFDWYATESGKKILSAWLYEESEEYANTDIYNVLEDGFREQDLLENFESYTENTIVELNLVFNKWISHSITILAYEDMTADLEVFDLPSPKPYGQHAWELTPGYYYEIVILEAGWDGEFSARSERFYVEGHQMSVYIGVDVNGEPIELPEQQVVYGVDRQKWDSLKQNG